MKAFSLSAGLISLHLDALLCGEDYIPHACLYEAFPILIGIPRLDEAFIFYLHHGFSQALVLNLHSSKLVNPFACCVCVGRTCHAPCISTIQDYVDA